MTLTALLDALLDLDEAGYGPNEIVLTTRTGSAAGEFHLAAVFEDESVARIPGIAWADAKIIG